MHAEEAVSAAEGSTRLGGTVLSSGLEDVEDLRMCELFNLISLSLREAARVKGNLLRVGEQVGGVVEVEADGFASDFSLTCTPCLVSP